MVLRKKTGTDTLHLQHTTTTTTTTGERAVRGPGL